MAYRWYIYTRRCADAVQKVHTCCTEGAQVVYRRTGGVQEEDIRCTNASLMMHRRCVNDV